MGLKTQPTPAEGRELAYLMQRMITKRGATGKDDTVKLDPVRTDFKEFLGNVCFGKLVNPLIPKETGKDAKYFIHQTYITIFREELSRLQQAN